MAAILENNKAGRKLFFAGYTYNKKKTSADAVYWVCSERVKYDCKGSAKTLIDLTQPREINFIYHIATLSSNF